MLGYTQYIFNTSQDWTYVFPIYFSNICLDIFRTHMIGSYWFFEVLQGTQPYHSANDELSSKLVLGMVTMEAGNTLRRDYYGMKHQHVNINYIFTYLHNIYCIYIYHKQLKTITYVKTTTVKTM